MPEAIETMPAPPDGAQGVPHHDTEVIRLAAKVERIEAAYRATYHPPARPPRKNGHASRNKPGLPGRECRRTSRTSC